MTPLLQKISDDTGTPLRDLELKWEECRNRIQEQYGRQKAGTYEYVRVVRMFVEELDLSYADIGL